MKRYAIMLKDKGNPYRAYQFSCKETLEEAIAFCKVIKTYKTTERTYVRDREKKEIVFEA